MSSFDAGKFPREPCNREGELEAPSSAVTARITATPGDTRDTVLLTALALRSRLPAGMSSRFPLIGPAVPLKPLISLPLAQPLGLQPGTGGWSPEP